MHLCFYVNGHGFGHATRAQAAIEALLRDPAISVEVRTTASARAFSGLDRSRCELIRCGLEPGVVQRDSFDHDLAATARAWRGFIEAAPGFIEAQREQLLARNVSLVLSDVSAIACAIADGICPSIVVGNFTWDWILEPYVAHHPTLAAIVAQLTRWYARATHYARLPLSHDAPMFGRQTHVDMLARKTRLGPAIVRQRLGLSPRDCVVLLSFGGFGANDLSVRPAANQRRIRCIWENDANEPPGLLSISGSQPPYTDILAAADVVVSKPGYSIIAECVAQQKPLVWVPRGSFREAGILERFLRMHWTSHCIRREDLSTDAWLEVAKRLAKRPTPILSVNGANQIAALARSYLAR
jgi:hypothetical protein